jgi:Cof subfamily protein (haloacid dehalogenase superfamily)
MAYRLFLSDMDGTLLRTDGTISERTRKAVERFTRAGGYFTLATGRSVESVAPFIRQLDIRVPVILLNGSLLWDPNTGTDLARLDLPPETVAQVWAPLLDHDVDFLVYGPRQAVSRTRTERVAQHLMKDGMACTFDPDLRPETAGPVLKILVIGGAAVLDELETALRATSAAVRLVRSEASYLEILPPGGGKGSLLPALLAYLSVTAAEALAVGDYLNDLDLLAAAGLGVAMANAHPQVLRQAQRWTGTNEEDGVAELLEAILAGQPVGRPPSR